MQTGWRNIRSMDGVGNGTNLIIRATPVAVLRLSVVLDPFGPCLVPRFSPLDADGSADVILLPSLAEWLWADGTAESWADLTHRLAAQGGLKIDGELIWQKPAKFHALIARAFDLDPGSVLVGPDLQRPEHFDLLADSLVASSVPLREAALLRDARCDAIRHPAPAAITVPQQDTPTLSQIEPVVARLNGRIADLEARLDKTTTALTQLHNQRRDQDARLTDLARAVIEAESEIEALRGSTSWRITRPMRGVSLLVARLRRSAP